MNNKTPKTATSISNTRRAPAGGTGVAHGPGTAWRSFNIGLYPEDEALLDAALKAAEATGRRGWTKAALLRWGLRFIDGSKLPHNSLA